MVPGFDPFLLLRILRHRSRIRSLHFILSSPASCPHSIRSFCFGFSDIMLGFDPFLSFRVLRYHTQIQSLPFVSGSLASCLDSMSSFCFDFSSIALGFNPFLFFMGSPASYPDFIIFSIIVFRFSSSSSASCLSITYLFRYHVQSSLIFFGIMSEFFSSSSESCSSIAYIFRHHVRLSLSFPTS